MKKGRRRKQKRNNMLEKGGFEGRQRISYEGIWDKDWYKEKWSKKSWHKFVFPVLIWIKK